MENLRRNILQTTLLDGNLNEHIGSREHLLPAMVTAYLKAKGACGSQKLDQYRRRIEIENAQAEDEVVGTASCHNVCRASNELADIDEVDSGATRIKDDVHLPATDQAVSDEEGTVEEDPDAVLARSGVAVQVKTLLEYEQNSSDIGGAFDFIIADPFQKIPKDNAHDLEGSGQPENWIHDELVDDKGVTIYVQCLRRLLTPGGFCFVFLNWSRIRRWTKYCERSRFEIICEPFLVMKDPARVQKMKMKI